MTTPQEVEVNSLSRRAVDVELPKSAIGQNSRPGKAGKRGGTEAMGRMKFRLSNSVSPLRSSSRCPIPWSFWRRIDPTGFSTGHRGHPSHHVIDIGGKNSGLDARWSVMDDKYRVEELIPRGPGKEPVPVPFLPPR